MISFYRLLVKLLPDNLASAFNSYKVKGLFKFLLQNGKQES